VYFHLHLPRYPNDRLAPVPSSERSYFSNVDLSPSFFALLLLHVHFAYLFGLFFFSVFYFFLFLIYFSLALVNLMVSLTLTIALTRRFLSLSFLNIPGRGWF